MGWRRGRRRNSRERPTRPASRPRRIRSRLAARHGLAPFLGLKRGRVSTRDPAELARRARTALEGAGGMFTKLGQLLATRPDLLPPEALTEFGRLHASARPLTREEVQAAIAAEVGDIDAVFAEIDWEPLGSASIAQAHTARLHDGREVVLKIRRPALEDVVERDLAIAVWLARTAERRTNWGRAYEVTALAEEFAHALRAELDFRHEGEATVEMAAAVADYPGVRVPWIDEAHTTERLLVMERLVGPTLSAAPRERLVGDAGVLGDDLCASQVTAMMAGERFHGDPHPGNVVLCTDGSLGLIDFGVTGKLDTFERSSMFQMLLAIKLEEPSLLYESLVAVGALSPARDPDEIERALARFMAANLGPGLPPAQALTDLLRLTTELGLRLPPQASTMFRALATLAGTLEQLSPGYPLIERVAALGGAEARERMTPASVGEFVQHEWAQLGPLLRRAPRHLDRLATVVEHGGLTARVRLFADAADVRVVERLLDRAVLAVLSLGVGLLSVLMLGTEVGPELAGADVRLIEVLGWTGLFAGTVLMLRVLLDVLRAEPRGP
ncbi:AarF/ABC1/UbiB kinase family protein [Egibacter rhizosphaerae]|uniref:AarF/ABC1/UbiB kinase family protein n=1 Tax=Egibacter rhizosphaerae TaxID=1670831 RepID=A0A411YF60_9ACTN|nr:AarF/ABC1/UbiB kinase family protein [Egibacter rhizosphaerae]